MTVETARAWLIALGALGAFVSLVVVLYYNWNVYSRPEPCYVPDVPRTDWGSLPEGGYLDDPDAEAKSVATAPAVPTDDEAPPPLPRTGGDETAPAPEPAVPESKPEGGKHIWLTLDMPRRYFQQWLLLAYAWFAFSVVVLVIGCNVELPQQQPEGQQVPRSLTHNVGNTPAPVTPKADPDLVPKKDPVEALPPPATLPVVIVPEITASPKVAALWKYLAGNEAATTQHKVEVLTFAFDLPITAQEAQRAGWPALIRREKKLANEVTVTVTMLRYRVEAGSFRSVTVHYEIGEGPNATKDSLEVALNLSPKDSEAYAASLHDHLTKKEPKED